VVCAVLSPAAEVLRGAAACRASTALTQERYAGHAVSRREHFQGGGSPVLRVGVWVFILPPAGGGRGQRAKERPSAILVLGICNPVGAIGSAALMLEHFGLHDEAKAVQRAIEDVTGNGIRTRDVGGTATTAEVTAAIIDSLAN